MSNSLRVVQEKKSKKILLLTDQYLDSLKESERNGLRITGIVKEIRKIENDN